MKKGTILSLLLYSMFAVHCTKEGAGSADIDGRSVGSTAAAPGAGGTGQGTAGVVTAGEWNDLDHWSFWDSLMLKPDYKKHTDYWKFYNNNRVAVRVVDAGGRPAANTTVQLKKGGVVTFTARTDNWGKAELWADLFVSNTNTAMQGYQLDINNGAQVVNSVKLYNAGTNEVVLANAVPPSAKIEIAFVVDATGSMGDELSYLQTELNDVVNRVHSNNPSYSILTSSVFYRDIGDEYITRVSGFTSDAQTTINFIKAQKADGGGDFPEAVHTALEKSLQELQWSNDAKSRILFLLLDAPPHHETAVLTSLQNMVSKAAEKGIKIIPITASGINKETEFLMRFMALTTNGTYVFITNHSGVGNNHLEATTGSYQVEYLNNLMVRLINKYAQ